ncbi:MAG: hypothetical protein J5840_02805 [Lachnospiraceae bacterium]|nr:hypothetical protein [Lachnospiraceae bacterium]
MDKKSKNLKIYILSFVGLAVLLGLQFVLHRATPFMKDDLWYSTNLSNGGSISSPMDIIESQVWHYFNWGGRVINHALLQVILSLGEFGADIMNILATIVLGLVICLVAKVKNPLFYLLAEAMIVSFNASIHFSMYWESGSANYLYSSSWILLYIYVILRSLNPDKKKLKGIEIWIIPLSLAAGWSTENMGPSCFVLTAFAIVWGLIKNKKTEAYLIEGAVCSAVGSALLILAPGNFVRNEFVEKVPLKNLIENRFNNFLESSCGFLFPTLMFAVILFSVQLVIFVKRRRSEKISDESDDGGQCESGAEAKAESFPIEDIALFGIGIVAQCAMILSPTYPQRASFGIMCVLIAYIISVLSKIAKENSRANIALIIIGVSIYIHALITVCTDLVFPYF